jgi:NDP-sugar pyrophosphorylase family protein
VIVIPMAGLSRRFSDAGYSRPKYMLDLHGRSVFAHAVSSFEAYFDSEPFLFIAREEAGTPAFIEKEVAALGIERARSVIVAEPTRGQADTVKLGLDRAGVSEDEPLTIFNIDTIRPGFRHPEAPWTGSAAGYLEVMRGSDPGFSYIRANPDSADQRVTETVEKQVISDLASTGLYVFRTARLFSDCFEAQAEAGVTAGELYIAPLYNELLARGLAVHYHLVPEREVIFCGTPAQYEGLLASPERLQPPADKLVS